MNTTFRDETNENSNHRVHQKSDACGLESCRRFQTLYDAQYDGKTHDRNSDVGGKQPGEFASGLFGRRWGWFSLTALDGILFPLNPKSQ
jgi:hypothetical protein